MQICIANSHFTSANDNDNYYLICFYLSYKFTYRFKWEQEIGQYCLQPNNDKE